MVRGMSRQIKVIKITMQYLKHPLNYGSTGYGVFKRGVQNLWDFCLLNNKCVESYFKDGIVSRSQKIGIFALTSNYEIYMYLK